MSEVENMLKGHLCISLYELSVHVLYPFSVGFLVSLTLKHCIFEIFAFIYMLQIFSSTLSFIFLVLLMVFFAMQVYFYFHVISFVTSFFASGS